MMKKKYADLTWFCLLCYLTMLPSEIKGQNGRDSIAGKVHAIPDVTVKADRIPSQLTSGNPTQRLDRAEMERIGAFDVSDAVRHFSGVNVKDYGGIGGLKTISIRGMGAQHTAVSYDGVAIGDCQSGQVDISRFSLGNVSSLTLSIGQSDDIFQTARMFASAGALNIETRNPRFDVRNYNLSVLLKAGSFGLLNPSVLYSRRLGKRVSLSAYTDYLRADGNYPFKMYNGEKLIASRRNNSDIQTFRGELNLFADIGRRSELKAKLYLFDSERGLPGSVIYDNPYAAERLSDRNYFAQLKYENRFSKKWKLQATGKFNYIWNRDYDSQASGVTDDRFRQTETYLSSTLWTMPIEGLSFSLAQDFIYNRLSTTLRNNQYPERFTYLTVLAGHYQSERLRISASLLNTCTKERVRTGKAADDRRRLSPSVSLSWKPLEAVGWRLRASYKDIFRLPTFNDLYYLLIGNHDLKPESTRQVNIGSTWTVTPFSFIEQLHFSVDAYYNRVDDKIVAIPTMFVWKMTNLGKVETIGTDVNWAGKMRLSDSCKLYLGGSYNFVRSEDITDRESPLWRNQIPYTPKHSGSGTMTLETPWLNITYNVTFASKRYRSTQNTPDNRIEPFADQGVSLSRTFSWNNQTLRIQADALNLGNKNYEIVRFYPMAGRNYKIAIAYYL